MKPPISSLKLKHLIWTSVVLLAAVALLAVTHLRAKPTAQPARLPVVEIAPVKQKDVAISEEWIGTLAGQVNANVKAQVAGYLLKRDYEEGSYVRKGQLLFEIDPRPFQAAVNQRRDADGELWQRRFPSAGLRACFDRALRTVKEYNEKVEYIHLNPVRAGLVRRPEDWSRPAGSSYNEYACMSADESFSRRTV